MERAFQNTEDQLTVDFPGTNFKCTIDEKTSKSWSLLLAETSGFHFRHISYRRILRELTLSLPCLILHTLPAH